MVKIICSACSKALSIDESKLPMKEVSFPCPLCKTKLLIDRRQLDPGSTEPVRAQQAEASAGSGSGGAASAPQAPVDAPLSQYSDAAGGPPALIVGNGSPELESAARALGLTPAHRATPAEGREYFVQEFPELVILVPETISAPPMDDLVPMTGVSPPDRRRGFFVLVGDGLRTLDGNAAFLYQVNLVVAKKDVGALPRIVGDARKDHDRLGRHFMQAATE
jgi:DNA-directed RNA polymerase subunit RPC12/RpoP